MSRGPATWKSSDVAWAGARRPYDLVKEILQWFVVLIIAIPVLAWILASPDPPPVTFKAWAQQSPMDFLNTTLSEVNKTSLSATYGPPYESSPGHSTQGWGFLSPEKWFGQTIPVNTYTDFVAQPLSSAPSTSNKAAVSGALSTWSAASASQQTSWSKAYQAALQSAPFTGGAYDVPTGNYGPLGTILSAQYLLALSGGLDNAFHANETNPAIWYANNQTFPMLYFGDSGQGGGGPDCKSAEPKQQNKIAPQQKLPRGYGCWYYNQAVTNTSPRYAGYLAGDSWGITNEVGNFPGAWWLVPYTIWYQFGPGLTSQSADLIAMLLTGLVSIPFILLPWIPGLRDIPKLTRVYKLMWSDYYASVQRQHHPQPTPSAAAKTANSGTGRTS
jgi:hypothetical protein